MTDQKQKLTAHDVVMMCPVCKRRRLATELTIFTVPGAVDGLYTKLVARLHCRGDEIGDRGCGYIDRTSMHSRDKAVIEYAEQMVLAHRSENLRKNGGSWKTDIGRRRSRRLEIDSERFYENASR